MHSGWAGAKRWRHGFISYSKLPRTLPSQLTVVTYVPELGRIYKGVDAGSEGSDYAFIEYHARRGPYDSDDYLIRIAGNGSHTYSGLLKAPLTIRGVHFTTIPAAPFTADVALRAAAEWAVDRGVTLDL